MTHPIHGIPGDTRQYVPCAVEQVQSMVVCAGSHVEVGGCHLPVRSRREPNAGDSDACTVRCKREVTKNNRDARTRSQIHHRSRRISFRRKRNMARSFENNKKRQQGYIHVGERHSSFQDSKCKLGFSFYMAFCIPCSKQKV